MNERLTWQQIQEKYPNQWVGMTDVEYRPNGINIASAIVSDSTSPEGDLTARMLNGELIARYTTPNNDIFIYYNSRRAIIKTQSRYRR